MKLYATTTSERASNLAKKGGNELLRIELQHKNKRIGQIELRAVGANGWKFEVWNIGGEGLTFTADNLRELQNGVKQKGECKHEYEAYKTTANQVFEQCEKCGHIMGL